MKKTQKYSNSIILYFWKRLSYLKRWSCFLFLFLLFCSSLVIFVDPKSRAFADNVPVTPVTPPDITVTVVPSAAPSSTVTPTVTSSPTPTLAPVAVSYYLSFGPKGIPSDSWNTARKLLNLLSDATAIFRYSNGEWLAYFKDVPAWANDDFAIKEGEGYTIIFNGKPELSFLKKLKYSDINSLNYNISNGWTYISIPKKLINSSRLRTAENMCDSINSQAGMAKKVEFRPLSTDSNQYVSHTCGTRKDNFTISSGQAYFIQSGKDSAWNLTKTKKF